MATETLRTVAERIRNLSTWAKEEYASLTVELRDDEYEVDLGAFGSKSTSITLQEEEYQIDPQDLLNQGPLGTSGLDECADEIEALIEELDDAPSGNLLDRLSDTLVRLSGSSAEAEVRLALALQAVYDLARKTNGVVQAIVTALPEKPLPWPGALRSDVDYTADDFPRRYQPPPGYGWNSNVERQSLGIVGPAEAKQITVADLEAKGDNGVMLLDDKGRVRWIVNADGDYSSGGRWLIWAAARDGIPAGTLDYGVDTPPLALDQDGIPIPEPTTKGTKYVLPLRNWKNDSTKARAIKRLAEIRAEFSTGDFLYDPLTVPLKTESTAVRTDKLRRGEEIIGFGRVLDVYAEGDKAQIITNRNGEPYKMNLTPLNNRWSVYEIDVSDRDSVPTALSLPKAGSATVGDYDPLTVEVAEAESAVRTDELRVGDDITGSGFGRVLSVSKDGEGFEIVMDRNGTRNTFKSSGGAQVWYVRKVIGVDREAQPAAITIGEPAPSVTSDPRVSYEPLTVSLATSTTFCDTDKLRLGDFVFSYGRVIEVRRAPAEKFVLVTINANGERVEETRSSFNWNIRAINGVRRADQPTALSFSEFSVAAPVVSSGPDYDPLTVAVAPASSLVRTRDLRVGDEVRDYGRVLEVNLAANSRYQIITGRSGTGERYLFRKDARANDQWNVRKLIGVNRSLVPAARTFGVSLTPPGVSYDPLTIQLGSLGKTVDVKVRTDKLRLGDEINGVNYGRVVGVKRVGDNDLLLSTNRGGRLRDSRVAPSRRWYIRPIVGVDRATQPTALLLSETTGLVLGETKVTVTQAYDPLTVPLKAEPMTLVTSELRLGDDVRGSSFGRLTSVEVSGDNVKLIMDRSGTTNTFDARADQAWSINPIDVTDRDSVPAAVSLTPVAA